MSKKLWSEEETLLAFLLYCKIPFAKTVKTTPEVIELATLINRSPSAVAMKLGNFGRFDPELQKRGIKGLSNASKQDRHIWERFERDGESLVFEAEKLLSRRKGIKLEASSEEITNIPIGSSIEKTIKSRIGQQFFRESILSSYGSKCCITGISIPSLLVASHIKPWSVSNPETERVNPANGLLLNAFHDKAFDKGLITINKSFEIVISDTVPQTISESMDIDWLREFSGKGIKLPDKFLPDANFIEYHNDYIFLS